MLSNPFENWFDTDGLIFKIARTEEELRAVYECRAKGYSDNKNNRLEDWMDEFDDYAIQYLSIDQETGEILGVMRMISTLDGPIEVQSYLDLSLWLNDDNILGEYSRFTIPKSTGKRRDAVKLGLFTIGYRDALRRQHSYQVLWTTKLMMPLYSMMLYKPYPGKPNTFTHKKLGNREHILMGIDLPGSSELYRNTKHPLYEFMHEKKLSNVILD